MILLPVPRTLRATHVVAAPAALPSDPVAMVEERWASLPWPDDPPPVSVEVREVGADDPVLGTLLEVVCCADCSPEIEPLFPLLSGRSAHLAVTCTAPPGWPPLHLWAGSHAVDALAAGSGGVRVDADAARPLPDPWRPPPLAAVGDFAVGRWIRVHSTVDGGAFRLSTLGLSRLGLPELRVLGVRLGEIESWTHTLHGLAHVLVMRLFADIASYPRRGSRTAPAELTVTPADVAAAEAQPVREHAEGLSASEGQPARVALYYEVMRDGSQHFTVSRVF